jgi:hypothetical protein
MNVEQRSTKRAMLSASVCAVVAGALASQAMAVDNFKISIGVRETGTTNPIGGNGGTQGAVAGTNTSIEWINFDGPNLVADGTWQHITFNFGTDPVTTFAGTQPAGGAANQLDGIMGALENLRVRNINGVTAPITLFVDNIVNTVGGVPTVVEDFESYAAVATPSNGAPEVVFRDPRFSGSTNTFLTPTDTGNVTAESADQGLNSYRLGFQFNSSTTSNWVRLTTNGTANKPNPAINFAPGSSLTFSLRAVVTPVLQGWNVDADGSWNTESNWTGAAVSPASNIPNSTSAVARFGGAIAITAPRTVTIDTAPTVSQVVFNSPISYTIAAVEGQGLILNAPAGFDTSLTVEAGSHRFTAPIALTANRRLAIAVNNANSVLTLEKAMVITPVGTSVQDMVKSGPGTAVLHDVTYNAVSLTGGTLNIAAGTNTTSKVDSLTISGTVAAPTAKLDITNNRLVVDWDTAAATPRPDALLSTRSKIVAGFATGDWSGNGITSSTAAADSRYGIGYGDAATLAITDFGIPVDAQATLVRLTFKGDANLDGTVAFADLVLLAQNYDSAYDPTGPGGPRIWSQGDFTYDGKVDFSDLVPLAQNYNLALTEEQLGLLGADFAADYALAQSFVPEPTTLGAIAGATTILLRRRRSC